MCGRGTHLPVSYQFPFFPAQHPRPLLSPAPTPPAFSHPPSSLLHRQHPHASSEWSPAWRSLVSLATNGRISWWRRKWKAAKVSSRDGANSVPSPSLESLDAPPPSGGGRGRSATSTLAGAAEDLRSPLWYPHRFQSPNTAPVIFPAACLLQILD
jgi:hypothetical protein